MTTAEKTIITTIRRIRKERAYLAKQLQRLRRLSGRKGRTWTPKQRAEHGEKMRIYWAELKKEPRDS